MVGTRGGTSRGNEVEKDKVVKLSYILKCEYCNTPFLSKTDLDTHVDLLHTGKYRKFSCMHCGDMYTSRQGLKQHVQKKHTGEITKPVCPECNKVCSSQAWLNNHVKKMHTYACVHCNEIFKKRWRLNIHVSGIHVVCPYQCDYCENKNFASNDSCKKHTRIVHILELGPGSKEKPFVFKCQLKQKRRRGKGGSFRVLRRPFKCSRCGKAFAHKTSLKAHVQRWHVKRGRPEKRAAGPTRIEAKREEQQQSQEQQQEQQQQSQEQQQGQQQQQEPKELVLSPPLASLITDVFANDGDADQEHPITVAVTKDSVPQLHTCAGQAAGCTVPQQTVFATITASGEIIQSEAPIVSSSSSNNGAAVAASPALANVVLGAVHTTGGATPWMVTVAQQSAGAPGQLLGVHQTGLSNTSTTATAVISASNAATQWASGAG